MGYKVEQGGGIGSGAREQDRYWTKRMGYVEEQGDAICIGARELNLSRACKWGM